VKDVWSDVFSPSHRYSQNRIRALEGIALDREDERAQTCNAGSSPVGEIRPPKQIHHPHDGPKPRAINDNSVARITFSLSRTWPRRHYLTDSRHFDNSVG
jgi:hypothetical protein